MARDTVTTLSSRVAALVLTMLQSVILARYLLPVGRGQYATLLLLPHLVAVLAPLGIQWAVVYRLRIDKNSTSNLLQSGLGLACLLGVAGLGVVLVLQYFLYDALLQGLSVLAITAASLLVPVRTVDSFFRGVFRGTLRIPVLNLINAVRPLLTIAGVVVVIVIAQAGVTGLVWVVLAAEAMMLIVAGRYLFRQVAPRPRLDPDTIRPLLSYGLRIYAFAVLIFVNNRLGLALVRYFLDYEEVGYYVTAVTLGELLWTVPNSLAFVLFPRIAGAPAETQRALTTAVARVTVVIVGVSCLAVAALAHPAIRLLYGVEFLPAVAPLLVLLPGIFAMSLQEVLGADVSGRGYPGRVTVAAGIGVSLNLALTIWLVPRYGPTGAAAAASASYIVFTLLVLGTFRRLAGTGLAETLLLRRQDLAAIRERIRTLMGKS